MSERNKGENAVNSSLVSHGIEEFRSRSALCGGLFYV